MRTSLSTALLVCLAAASAAPVALAATPAAKPGTAKATAAAKAPSRADMARQLRVSEDGFRAAREIRLARLDIFGGRPADAMRRTQGALRALDAATRETALHMASAARAPAGTRGPWIPIDGRLIVGDTVTATPVRTRHLAAANTHLKAGEHAKAMEELRLAEVDVGFDRLLLPLASTRTAVQEADALMKQGKIYEGSMALKRAEDGIVEDLVVVIDRPKR